MKFASNPIPEKNKFIFSTIFSVIFSACFFVFYYFKYLYFPSVIAILGLSFLTFGIFWFLFFIFSFLWIKRNLLWSFFIFLIATSVGYPFLINEISLLDFLFYVGSGIGISLIISGIYWKLFGLIIPGAILIGITPGVYFAWENSTVSNPLEQTGVMLVWFAFGWGLITIFSRTLTKNFVWWPLIPGGILAVVGWGLYIAGNPDSAVVFIGNTGSIGLIIFGIYILLMRRSFHQ